MRSRFAITLALLLISTAVHAQELSLNDFLEVAGLVRASTSSPVENAVVIAFSLSDHLNLQTVSGRMGQFELPPLEGWILLARYALNRGDRAEFERALAEAERLDPLDGGIPIGRGHALA